MKKTAEFLVKHPFIVISTIIAITVIFGIFALKIKINPDITDYLPKSDKVIIDFKRVGEEYGGNLTAIIVAESDSIFTSEFLLQIKDLSESLSILEGVNSVTSISNILDIKSTDGSIEIGSLFERDEMYLDKKYIAEVKDYVMHESMYKGKLISDDGKKMLIAVNMAEGYDKTKTADEIQKTANRMNKGCKYYFGGLPFLMLEVNNLIVKDIVKLIIPCAFLMILFLFLSYKTLVGVLLPMVSVVISIIWTIGIMSISGVEITIISNIIPIILLAVGSAYSIHMISKYYEERNSGLDKHTAIEKSINDVSFPIMLAAVTTLIGFLSFIFGSYLIMIQDFGIFTAIGVCISFILSVTFIPSALSIFGDKEHVQSESRTKKMLDITDGIFLKYNKQFFSLIIILFVVSVLFIPSIKRSADIMDYFKNDSPVRISDKIIENDFGGSTRVQLICRGDMTSPEVLQELVDIEKFLEDSAGVTHPSSIAGILRRMNRIVEDKDTIPDTSEKIGNLYFLLDGEESVLRMINSSKDEAIIEGTLSSGMESGRVREFLSKVDNYIKEKRGIMEISVTGMPSINLKLDKSIIKSTIISISLSIVIIFIVLLLMLRSPLFSLIGVLPIVFTVAVIFGIMGILRIPLDIATALVGSISIGIGIDYSIHFISRLRSEMQKEKNMKKCVENTIKTTGRAILTNVFTVASGFAVLYFSSLQPLSHFGLLISLTMFVSGFFAIIILTTLAQTADTKIRRNNV